jgi:hypothetical protein
VRTLISHIPHQWKRACLPAFLTALQSSTGDCNFSDHLVKSFNGSLQCCLRARQMTFSLPIKAFLARHFTTNGPLCILSFISTDIDPTYTMHSRRLGLHMRRSGKTRPSRTSTIYWGINRGTTGERGSVAWRLMFGGGKSTKNDKERKKRLVLTN